jgi:molybdate transport system ATP-binding protein
MVPEFDIAIQKTMRAGARRFDLQVQISSASKRLVISGPSGAGKSMILKAVAGLLRPDAGRIRVRGASLFDAEARIDLTPQARRMAYVFQDYALFPHLNVRQNIAFGLQQGWRNPAAQVDAPAVTRWLQAFDLAPVAHQYPDQLSGGQQQRTALARALVGAPRALLLDEPFAALDAGLRQQLRGQLRDLVAELDLPMILISHDADDIADLAGDVVYLNQGRLATAGA